MERDKRIVRVLRRAAAVALTLQLLLSISPLGLLPSAYAEEQSAQKMEEPGEPTAVSPAETPDDVSEMADEPTQPDDVSETADEPTQPDDVSQTDDEPTQTDDVSQTADEPEEGTGDAEDPETGGEEEQPPASGAEDGYVIIRLNHLLDTTNNVDTTHITHIQIVTAKMYLQVSEGYVIPVDGAYYQNDDGERQPLRVSYSEISNKMGFVLDITGLPANAQIAVPVKPLNVLDREVRFDIRDNNIWVQEGSAITGSTTLLGSTTGDQRSFTLTGTQVLAGLYEQGEDGTYSPYPYTATAEGRYTFEIPTGSHVLLAQVEEDTETAHYATFTLQSMDIGGYAIEDLVHAASDGRNLTVEMPEGLDSPTVNISLPAQTEGQKPNTVSNIFYVDAQGKRQTIYYAQADGGSPGSSAYTIPISFIPDVVRGTGTIVVEVTRGQYTVFLNMNTAGGDIYFLDPLGIYASADAEGKVYVATTPSLAVRPATPQRIGYVADGQWYTDPVRQDARTQFDFLTPLTHDITLYPKWTPQRYSLVFRDTRTKATLNVAATEADEEVGFAQSTGSSWRYDWDAQKIPAFSLAGADVEVPNHYTFRGWYVMDQALSAASGGGASAAITVAGTTYYPFVRITPQVTGILDGWENGSPSPTASGANSLTLYAGWWLQTRMTENGVDGEYHLNNGVTLAGKTDPLGRHWYSGVQLSVVPDGPVVIVSPISLPSGAKELFSVNGTYTFRLTDRYGITNRADAPVYIYYDNTRPIFQNPAVTVENAAGRPVNAVSVDQDTYLYADNADVVVINASDVTPGSGVAEYSASFTGNATISPISGRSNAFAVKPLLEGTSVRGVLQITAKDYAGNTTTASRTMIVDRGAPTVSYQFLNNAVSGTVYLGAGVSSAALEITVSDVYLYLAQNEENWRPTLRIGYASTLAGLDSTTQFPTALKWETGTEENLQSKTASLSLEEMSHIFSSMAQGYYRITTTATDVVGNSTTDQLTLCYDTEAPTFTLNGPSGWQSSSATVSVRDLRDNFTAEGDIQVFYRYGMAGSALQLPRENRAFLASDPGTYYVWAVDQAGNRSAEQSYTLRIDGSAPVFASVTKTPQTEWTNQSVTVTVSATDPESGVAFIRCSALTGVENVGVETPTSTGTNPQTFTFSNEQNATYHFQAENGAGMFSTSDSVAVRIDKTYPTGEITMTGSDGSASGTWKSLADLIRYHLFFRNRQTIKITATDSPQGAKVSSGVASIEYWLYEGSGDLFSGTSSQEGRRDILASKTYEDNWKTCPSNGIISVDKDSRFILFVRIADRAGNVTYLSSDGVIVDTLNPQVEDSGGPAITLPIPTAPVQNGVYGSNVEVAFSVKDPLSNGVCSGIASVSYTLYRGEQQVGDEVTLFQATGDTPVQSLSRDQLRFTIPVGIDSNDVVVRIVAQDRAGNVSTVSSNPIKIDNKPPQVSVSFSGTPVNGKYFAAPRTATITVKELNFSPDNVELNIGGEATLGRWVTGEDGETHTMTVSFDRNQDYTFSLTVTDLAGHRVNNEQVTYTGAAPNSFTVDLLRPQVALSFRRTDGAAVGEKGYSSTGVVMTISVTERNFDPASVGAGLAVTRDGNRISVPLQWRQVGDQHTAVVTLGSDGLYSVSLSCGDMAGNTMDTPLRQTFYVDQTAPTVSVTGIANQTATNTPNAITPVVTVQDQYAELTQVSIQLVGGKNQTIANAVASRSAGGGGIQYRLKNILLDDLYTLRVTAKDPAGNVTTRFQALDASGRMVSLEALQFSVNRHGSVFALSPATAALVEERFVNKPQNVVVIETNVNTLNPVHISLSKDSLMVSDLQEGEDYAVAHHTVDGGWHQNTYTIPASAFGEDGTYSLSIVSTDAAGNESDSSNAQQVHFTLDTTPPALTVYNLATGEFYAEDSKAVSFQVSDLNLTSVTMTLNGEPFATWTDPSDLKKIKQGYTTTQTIPSAKAAQTLVIVCTDAAGNVNPVKTQTIDRFYVTTDPWIRFTANRPLFYGSIALLSAGSIGALVGMKRKKDREMRGQPTF